MNTHNRIRAIIVDDEPHCIANLSAFISQHCAEIEIVTTATTLPDASALLAQDSFELAFLDIELCGGTAFSLLEGLSTTNFAIVFVTAYDRYAVRAFRVEAIDYLLKPLSASDVAACCDKVRRHLGRMPLPAADAATAPTLPAPARKVIIREREHVYVIAQNDILYLKGVGAYTEVVFVFENRITSVLLSKTISFLEEEYDAPFFFRVHKSYLINLERVKGIHKRNVPFVEMSNSDMLPIAKRRIHDLMLLLNKQA